nr:MAG TPA: hypothetical protein [Crassvirales sp.]
MWILRHPNGASLTLEIIHSNYSRTQRVTLLHYSRIYSFVIFLKSTQHI